MLTVSGLRGYKGMVGKTALMVCLAVGLSLPAGAEELIRFAPKMFSDGPEAIEVSGTLTGPDVGYPNNTYVVSCTRDRKECFVTEVDADKGYVSRVTGAEIYPIVSWTNTEVVAKEEAYISGCSRRTISIARKRSVLLVVQEPINQTSTFCAKSETRVLKWTVEDPAYYRGM